MLSPIQLPPRLAQMISTDLTGKAALVTGAASGIGLATAEAFAVGARAGIDLGKLVELISAGIVNSGIFQMMVGKMLERLASHSMFAAPGALEQLKMCADCRVIDRMQAELPTGRGPSHTGER